MRTQPELSVEMWDCGDDECDCQRPQVVVRYPFYRPEPGIGICKMIAVGPLLSFGYGDPEAAEIKEQEKWFYAAQHWYGQHRTQQLVASERQKGEG